MKKRNIIAALVLTFTVGMGATAYAASSNNTTTNTPMQRLGLGRVTSMRGYDFMKNILADKLGMTQEEIDNELSSGKTPYQLLTEKGITQEELKTALVKERTEAIDEAVTKGTITEEQGENIKTRLETNMENCTGNFGENMGLGRGEGRSQGQGQGQGRGNMGNGQQKGCLIGNDN